MSRNLVGPTFAALLLLVPAHVLAGGPPWLSLPIDGVTGANADECGRRLAQSLHRPLGEDGITMGQREDQWYLSVVLEEDAALGEIEDAFQDSGFSVAKDRLRLFGHAILAIEIGAKPLEGLLKDLEAMPRLAVEESSSEAGGLLVTLDMPYPLSDKNDLPFRKQVGWSVFAGTDFSTPSTRSEGRTTARELPSFDDLRETIAKHDARLVDIRWSTKYACRPLGGVACADTDDARSVATAAQ